MGGTYNKGFVGGFRQVIAAEGAGALLTGLGPTAQGYFIQGWFKFGGVEVFKTKFAKAMGEESAWKNRTAITLGASAVAEFIADIFLCPFEATRIRLVSKPDYAPGMVSCAKKMAGEMGVVPAFYSGFAPILFKQIPYTMAKFVVQQQAAEGIYAGIGQSPATMSSTGNVTVSLGSGVIAGVAAAIISHPADTLLSKINKKGAGGDGGMVSRLGNIVKETGLVKLCTTGLGARCIMIGTLTAGQFVSSTLCSTLLVLRNSTFTTQPTEYKLHDLTMWQRQKLIPAVTSYLRSSCVLEQDGGNLLFLRL